MFYGGTRMNGDGLKIGATIGAVVLAGFLIGNSCKGDSKGNRAPFISINYSADDYLNIDVQERGTFKVDGDFKPTFGDDHAGPRNSRNYNKKNDVYMPCQPSQPKTQQRTTGGSIDDKTVTPNKTPVNSGSKKQEGFIDKCFSKFYKNN